MDVYCVGYSLMCQKHQVEKKILLLLPYKN